MTRCFVLVETAVGKQTEVKDYLKKLKGVDSVDTVTGPYDIIVVADTDSFNDMGELIAGKFHNMPSITRTITCLSIPRSISKPVFA